MRLQKTLTRALLFLMLLACVPRIQAQPTASQKPTTIEGWADRLARFGKAIPQEKVFVHLDNTCYFLGDTIWYAAYTRRTDKDMPSGISRILYAELYNQDGFLVERQLVEMKNGRGNGCFALNDTLYGGYYELRAYTRWQLNWGITEHEHTSDAEAWFFNSDMAHEFYRDYDKLYSRVFPVYDKPKQPGEYFRDMTTRPLRRYFKSGAEEPMPMLSLFPEGGDLVAGLPCRIAFEAATEDGKWLEGKVELQRDGSVETLKNEKGEEVQAVATVSRGRGLFTFIPQAGQNYTALFTATDGRTAKASIERVLTDGVALSVARQTNGYLINVRMQGAPSSKSLGMTIMREGVVEKYETIEPNAKNADFLLPASELPTGVHQITVFDAEGRAWADRLFFITSPTLFQPTLTITGLKEEYSPFEQVELMVSTPSLQGKAGRESFSLAVRDAATQDATYDSGNILTEMLLASEIKGFVPQPQYFFQADDEEHRLALDLLMMTQGWRRFDWKSMATPGAFELTQPAEQQTQILRGEVLNYKVSMWQDDVSGFGDTPTPFQMEDSVRKLLPSASGGKTPEAAYRDSLRDPSSEGLSVEAEYDGMGQGEIFESIIAETYAHESHYPSGSYRIRGNIASARFNEKESPLKNEVRIHAEFTQPKSESILGDMQTTDGKFTIQAPRFEGYCVFFLAASDTTKWKAGKPHSWISMEEKDEPEFYVRINQHYPRFTKPYDHYQTAFYSEKQQETMGSSHFDATKFETEMSGITVRAARGGLRHFDRSKPAYIIDAYTAFNDACDAGLMEGRFIGRFHFINSLARLFAGDMNTHNTYLLEPRYDGYNISRNISPTKIDRFNYLMNLDSVRIYTDYSPRTGGDPRAIEENVERLSIDLQQLPDEGMRVTYRDRRYILQGFNVADDFYHPNYKLNPPKDGQQDYRRTLYWNPNVQLDANGQATIHFFTGSKPTIIAVDAQGQASDGTLLTTP